MTQKLGFVSFFFLFLISNPASIQRQWFNTSLSLSDSKAVSSSVSSGQQVYPQAASFPSTARPSEPFRYHTHTHTPHHYPVVWHRNIDVLSCCWHGLDCAVLRSAAMAQQMLPVSHSAGQMLAQMSRQSTPSGVPVSNNSPIQAGPSVPPGVWSNTRPPFNKQVDTSRARSAEKNQPLKRRSALYILALLYIVHPEHHWHI